MVSSIFVFFTLFVYVLIVSIFRVYLYVPKNHLEPAASRRLWAFLLDYVVVLVIGFVYILISIWTDLDFREKLTSSVENTINVGENDLPQMISRGLLNVLLFTFLSVTVQEVVMKGRTFGKKALGLGVKVEQGGLVAGVLLRNMLKPIDFFFLPLAILLPMADERRRWLHDKFSGTIVEDYDFK